MTPEFGEGLDKLIVELRNKIFGVLNGIDYDEYNPATDHLLVENYDSNNSEDKVRNKLALQKEFGLKQDKDIPVISVVGRLEPQKGYDLAAEILWPLLRNFDVQFVAVGGGDMSIAEAFRTLKSDFPEKVGIHLMPNFSLPHLVFAGSDIMFSRPVSSRAASFRWKRCAMARFRSPAPSAVWRIRLRILIPETRVALVSFLKISISGSSSLKSFESRGLFPPKHVEGPR